MPHNNILPRWDLSDLYPAHDSAELSADLLRLKEIAESFRGDFYQKIAALDANALGAAVGRYEEIQELAGKLASFGQLFHASNMASEEAGACYQRVQEALNDVHGLLLFFTLEINALSHEDMDARLAGSDALAHYQPWLREVRAFRDYQLDEQSERLISEQHLTGRDAWVRLYDEHLSALHVELQGEFVPLEQALHELSGEDGELRKAAAMAVAETLSANAPIFTMVTNVLAKDKQMDDGRRGYPDMATSRHLDNAVEAEVVDALDKAVKASFGQLSHRYYTMKAGWLREGATSMPYWDRNAPLEGGDRSYEWDEAVELVLNAYGDFSPAMREWAEPFFDNAWIDAEPRSGKSPGAFAHPTVPSVHPYLLQHFQGKLRDVMTLAHELGHGVHQRLSASQGALMADTPLTLAETASVFGEQLTFQALLKGAKTREEKRYLLASKVEDMLNTVIRQMAFYQFERKVHGARMEGELSTRAINAMWQEVQSESLGSAIELDESYDHFWSYIPHFIHSPFYVYAYAFGDCLVNALYAKYAEGLDGFEEKYLEMLKAGGTLRHKELLAPFGLDASDPAFWQKGLDVIAAMIDELEAL